MKIIKEYIFEAFERKSGEQNRDIMLNPYLANIKYISDIKQTIINKKYIPKWKIEKVINSNTKEFSYLTFNDLLFRDKIVLEYYFSFLSDKEIDKIINSASLNNLIELSETKFKNKITKEQIQSKVDFSKSPKEIKQEIEKISRIGFSIDHKLEPTGKGHLLYKMLKALDQAGEKGMRRTDIIKAANPDCIDSAYCQYFNIPPYNPTQFMMAVTKIGYGKYKINDFGKSYMKKYEKQKAAKIKDLKEEEKIIKKMKIINSINPDKFVRESLHEEDMGAQIPVSDPVIAQKLANGQAALNREDLKLQQLKDKMIPINKKKAQIQKAMIQAQEENAKKIQQQAKDNAEGQKLAKEAADAAAEVAAQNPTATPPLPTSESLLQNEMDKLELLEDHIVVLMQKENPDYKKIDELIKEAREEYIECPGCGKTLNTGDEEFAGGVCKSCEDSGMWIDPAGGVHYSNDSDYDPASLYEDNPISKNNFYDVSEAYDELSDEKKNLVKENYMHFVKVYQDLEDSDKWFIGKIFKEDPKGDWYGEIKAGDDDIFDNISYEPDYDILDIIDAMRKIYDKVEVLDELEYNDYVEDPPPGEIDEEGGVTGMHL